ncbi:hypothetical protein MIND_00081100 [Mycena indigotica]|uniref:GH16 domain-containing protein n=1 Tax=Mycena indigotica TaxID=2126181 RepID=A0A8H6TFB4_9AGAR|nr:uncharacterized protein MIND_00081100 [Mycena indigotica]KAF7315656.1 hypothetical protein MIND_00081100 [Mycena indigotica]
MASSSSSSVPAFADNVMYRRQISHASWTSRNSDSPYPGASSSPLLQPRYDFHPNPAEWGIDFGETDDDDLHRAEKPNHNVEFSGNPWSIRGLTNLGCLFILIAGILTLFIGYPVLSFRSTEIGTTSSLGNLGGRNGTGQVPDIGNWGLIDAETPEIAYVVPSWNGGEDMQLVGGFFQTQLDLPHSVHLRYSATNSTPTAGHSTPGTIHTGKQASCCAFRCRNNADIPIRQLTCTIGPRITWRLWYDPEAVTTANGNLVITLSQKETHNLSYEGGMLSTWNKFCFTGGYIETSVRLPGLNNIQGLWPAVWTMGNLGRAGYGASLEGMWPYSYGKFLYSCDVGTAPNQTHNGGPFAATVNGDTGHDGELSWLPGQRLSACTCPDQDNLHPGPKRGNGYVGRASPEIDVFEAQITSINKVLIPQVSQSAQWAPFDAAYQWLNTSDFFSMTDPTISHINSFKGSITQEATSIVTNTAPLCYEDNGNCFSIYGFEYRPGFDDGYITWIATNKVAWTIKGGAVGSNPQTQIGPRQISGANFSPVVLSPHATVAEPMYLIANLGMSFNFGKVDLEHLPFPCHLEIDYIRVYQPKSAINVGCSLIPAILQDTQHKHTSTRNYIQAYTNPNLTTWRDDFGQPFPKSSFLGEC